MDRLTERDEDEFGNADLIVIPEIKTDIYSKFTGDECTALYNVFDRLASYEDTGLTPDEIIAMKADVKPVRRGRWADGHRYERRTMYSMQTSNGQFSVWLRSLSAMRCKYGRG